MKILPSLNYSFTTDKTPEEIYADLNSVTKSPKVEIFHRVDGEFIGKVSISGFRIRSNIKYRNSFLPIIKGSVKAGENGSEVIIKMRMHPFVSVFLTIWLGGVFFAFFMGILYAFVEGIFPALPILLTTIIMIAFEQILTKLAFFIPARKSVQRIRELLC